MSGGFSNYAALRPDVSHLWTRQTLHGMGKDVYSASIAADANWYIGCLGHIIQAAMVVAPTRYWVIAFVADGGSESGQATSSL